MENKKLSPYIEKQFSPMEKQVRRFVFSALTNDERKRLNDE